MTEDQLKQEIDRILQPVQDEYNGGSPMLPGTIPEIKAHLMSLTTRFSDQRVNQLVDRAETELSKQSVRMSGGLTKWIDELTARAIVVQAREDIGSEAVTPPNPEPLDNASGELIEKLADIEHERWSGWMNWLYQHGTWRDDGSFTIQADKAKRWFDLSVTRYGELDEPTKEYDRIEVRKTLEAIRNHEALPNGNAPQSPTSTDAKCICNTCRKCWCQERRYQ